MSKLPKYVGEVIAKAFAPDQAQAIDENWHRFSNGFRLGDATRLQIIKEARMVLQAANKEQEAPKLR